MMLMAVVEYTTRAEVGTKGFSIFFISDEENIGKFVVGENSDKWSGYYYEGKTPLFKLGFDSKDTFEIDDVEGKNYSIVYEPEHRRAGVFDMNNMRVYKIVPNEMSSVTNSLLPSTWFFIGIIRRVITGKWERPKTFYVFDPSDKVVFEIKSDAPSAHGTIDDEKIDRKLGLALLVIYTYPIPSGFFENV